MIPTATKQGVNVPMATLVGEQGGNATLASAVYYSNPDNPRVKQLQAESLSRNGFGMTFVRAGTLDLMGKFVVPQKVRITVIMHGGELDLSHALFVFPVTDISLLCICGGVRIVLPPGVRVENTGLGVCGDFSSEMHSAVNLDPGSNLDAPLVRISGMAICGGATSEVNVGVLPLTIDRE